MDDTRRSPRPADREAAVDPILAVQGAVGAALDAHGATDARVAIALSGGRDSIALLDAAARIVVADRLVACHVHHGLSPNADRWMAFCADACAVRGIAFDAQRIEVKAASRTSLEAEARRARYLALASMAERAGASFVLLAHHQDDQAETVLLQLLRGAGPQGLAAMPPSYRWRGRTWLRPLLGVPRRAIDAYVATRELRYVDDESNARGHFRRNALRLSVVPALNALSPGYPATIARAADHQAEAARLLRELAAIDAAPHYDGVTLARAALAELAPHRARNLLRWFLHEQGLPAPSTARLAAMMAQLRDARRDAGVLLRHAGATVSVYRERIHVHEHPRERFAREWTGDAPLALPHGTLRIASLGQGELDAARLFAHRVTVRSRQGGERFRPAADRPRRALKHMLREASLAPWERESLPLVFAGDALAVVPGIGVDPAFRAAPPTRGVALVWEPHARPR
jgi:tRNA(Ile)-lysidine synthase